MWYAPDASASSIFVPFFASALSGADGKLPGQHSRGASSKVLIVARNWARKHVCDSKYVLIHTVTLSAKEATLNYSVTYRSAGRHHVIWHAVSLFFNVSQIYNDLQDNKLQYMRVFADTLYDAIGARALPEVRCRCVWHWLDEEL